MILTIRKVTEDANQQEIVDFSTKLSAPVFVLGTTSWTLYRDPATDTLTVDEPSSYGEDDIGKLKLGASAAVVENAVDITEDITGTIPKGSRKVLTINGVSPTDDGEFFIDGSECDSWEALGGSTIGIVDLCPSCTTCESVYRLKYEVENMKMWINTLKDVNLYAGSDIDTRQRLLNDKRQFKYVAEGKQPVDAALCSVNIVPDDDYLRLKGLQLLQQYITTVHMWNYIVSRNNASTVIDVAPEDTAGFTVQTKRALTSCGNIQAISCEISVYPLGIIEDNDYKIGPLPSRAGTADKDGYPISVYVPSGSNEVRFEPFWQDNNPIEVVIGGKSSKQNQALEPEQQKATVKTGPADDNKRSDYKIVMTNAADGTPGFIDAKFAGTYVVTVKFLPFVYYRAWRDEVVGDQTTHVDINIRGGTSQLVVGNTNADGSVSYDFGISGHTCYAIPSAGHPDEPTERDYLDAKTVPTCSVTFQIVWCINIKWVTKSLGENVSDEKEDIETYLYKANGIRAYYGDVLGNTIVEPTGSTSSDWDDRMYYTQVDY